MGEILGAEDCLNNERRRVCTLKCNSIAGELLEMDYKDLLAHLENVDESVSRLNELIKGKEAERVDAMRVGRVRHNLAECVEVRVSGPAAKPLLRKLEEIKPIINKYILFAHMYRLEGFGRDKLVWRKLNSSLATPKNSFMPAPIQLGRRKAGIFKYTEADTDKITKKPGQRLPNDPLKSKCPTKYEGNRFCSRRSSTEQAYKISRVFRLPRVKWAS